MRSNEPNTARKGGTCRPAGAGWANARAQSLVAVLALGLCGCGFQVVGPPELPFQTLYVAAPDYSSFGAEFRRYVASGGKTRLTSNPKEARGRAARSSARRSEKQILSLTSAGHGAPNIMLRYRVTFRLRDSGSTDLIAPSEITLQRDLTYDDDAILAKENEEQFCCTRT